MADENPAATEEVAPPLVEDSTTEQPDTKDVEEKKLEETSTEEATTTEAVVDDNAPNPDPDAASTGGDEANQNERSPKDGSPDIVVSEEDSNNEDVEQQQQQQEQQQQHEDGDNGGGEDDPSSLHAIVGQALFILQTEEEKMVALTTGENHTDNEAEGDNKITTTPPPTTTETEKESAEKEDPKTEGEGKNEPEGENVQASNEGGDTATTTEEENTETKKEGETEVPKEGEEISSADDGKEPEDEDETQPPNTDETNATSSENQTDGNATNNATDDTENAVATSTTTTPQEQLQVLNISRIEMMKVAVSFGIVSDADFDNYSTALSDLEQATLDDDAVKMGPAQDAFEQVVRCFDFAREQLSDLLTLPVDVMNDGYIQDLKALFIQLTEASGQSNEFSIPLDHFADVIAQSNMPLTDDLQLMLAKADTNNDGQINLKEFLEGMQNEPLLKLAKQTAIAGKKFEQAKDNFQWQQEQGGEDTDMNAFKNVVDDNEQKLVAQLAVWAEAANVTPQGFESLQHHLGVFDSTHKWNIKKEIPQQIDPLEAKRQKRDLLDKLLKEKARKELVIQENTVIDSHIAEMMNRKMQKDGKEQIKTFKNVADQESRYLALMALVRQEESLIEIQKKTAKEFLEAMTRKMSVARHKADSAVEEFRASKEKYCAKSASGKSGKKPADHVFATLQDLLAAKEASVTQERLRFIKLKNGVLKLDAVLTSKEKLGHGLHFIDFEQLKIENQSCHEKIEERNEELSKLKTKITTAVQVLSHMKEKLDFVETENKSRRTEVHRIEQELAIKRDIVSRQKRVREKVRVDNLDLQGQCGLLGQKNLLRDYEVGFDKNEEFINAIEELKNKHAEVESKTRNYKLRLTQLQRQRGGTMTVIN